MSAKRIPQEVLQRDLGQRVVRLREARGWKQAGLAQRLGVTVSRLSKWERGLNAPSLEDLTALLMVLEVSFEELVLGSAELVSPLPPAERTELTMYLSGFWRLLKPLTERRQRQARAPRLR